MGLQPNHVSSSPNRFQPTVEVLEGRRLLAGLHEGLAEAWQPGDTLTISVAPDGTDVSGSGSVLFASLGPTATNWQGAIVRAFETWASHIDLDIRLVADSGEAFGSDGLTSGDPRFGDVRIGAVPMSADVLATAVVDRSGAAGTWAGDILFNSAHTFRSNDEVFRAALHEAGHVLGLPHSDDPFSIMHPNASRTGRLTEQDIAHLREVYFGSGHDVDPELGSGESLSEGDSADESHVHRAASPTLIAAGTLDDEGPLRSHTFHVDSTQLVQFSLLVSAQPHASREFEATLYDSLGNVVHRVTTQAGRQDFGEAVLLGPGEYTIEVGQAGAEGGGEASFEYRVEQTVLDEHLGPEVEDPSAAPITPCLGGVGEFCYPNDIYSYESFIWIADELEPAPDSSTSEWDDPDWWYWYIDLLISDDAST